MHRAGGKNVVLTILHRDQSKDRKIEALKTALHETVSIKEEELAELRRENLTLKDAL